jgi:hypothetical protein
MGSQVPTDMSSSGCMMQSFAGIQIICPLDRAAMSLSSHHLVSRDRSCIQPYSKINQIIVSDSISFNSEFLILFFFCIPTFSAPVILESCTHQQEERKRRTNHL